MEPFPPEVIEQLEQVIRNATDPPLWSWAAFISTAVGVLLGGVFSALFLISGERRERGLERRKVALVLSQQESEEAEAGIRLKRQVIAAVISELISNLMWVKNLSKTLEPLNPEPSGVYPEARSEYWRNNRTEVLKADVPVLVQFQIDQQHNVLQTLEFYVRYLFDYLQGPSSKLEDSQLMASSMHGRCQGIIDELLPALIKTIVDLKTIEPDAFSTLPTTIREVNLS